MAEGDTKPGASSSSGGSSRIGFLGRKVGPMPVWLWGLIVVGIYYWYTRYGPGAQAKQQAAAAAQPIRVITVPGAQSRTVVIDRDGGGDHDRDKDHDRDHDHDRRRRPKVNPGGLNRPGPAHHDRRPDRRADRHRRPRIYGGGGGDLSGPQAAAAPMTAGDGVSPVAAPNGVVYDDTQTVQPDEVQPVYPEGQYVPAGT